MTKIPPSMKDAHEYIPQGGIDRENMPPRFGWMLIPVFIILGFIVAYFLP